MTSKIDPNVRYFRSEIKHHLAWSARVLYDGALGETRPADRVRRLEQVAAVGFIRDKYWYTLACAHSEQDVEMVIADLEQNLLAHASSEPFIHGVRVAIVMIRQLLQKSLRGEH